MSAGDRPRIRVVSAEVQRGGKYLITQRSARAVLPLLWEFPGGRVREGETDDEALRRTLHDRIGVQVDVHRRILEITHEYDSYSVTLAVYRCGLGDQDPYPDNVAALAWVSPEEFGDYPFPGADQKTVDQLLRDQS
jgi:8-oxo-dGTP diphosphatase